MVYREGGRAVLDEIFDVAVIAIVESAFLCTEKVIESAADLQIKVSS